MITPIASNLVWRKSSRSNGGGGECVEIAFCGPFVLVRDSKNPNGGHLTFTREQFGGFVSLIKSEQLDGPPARVLVAA